ncbi:unnamed protein product [Periconia digitata]|uniref:Uncharacterized protein n=1 Tax=Periconia digitata TaxID=1303443 RepID=A0A9W4XMI7_9PLEO|nr:unnamed protein product [Periconia digitata]
MVRKNLRIFAVILFQYHVELAKMLIFDRVVAQNLSTALIFEDDVDWDVRIRAQLLDLSRASRSLPKLNLEVEEDSYIPLVSEHPDLDPTDIAKRSSIPLSSDSGQAHESPYGRDWDVQWLGHCGASLPPPSPMHPTSIFKSNDHTVPSAEHLRFRSSAPQDEIATLYPPYTRLYHRTANSTLCLHAYAVTQRGARKLLYQFGMRDFSQGFDFALSDYCGGDLHRKTGETEGQRPMCLTVQPPLFSQFWGEHGESDIMSPGREGRMVGSRYIRWSVRAGLEAAVSGLEVDDQWPDGES